MPRPTPCAVAIVGGGPAGLMAAHALADRGVIADLFEAMPTVGRKFLVAGRGGLNLTHAEPHERFVQRYRERADRLAPLVSAFPPDALRTWAADLGVQTFVGTSGRVFPTDLKAARLLRAWVRRLRERGVRIHARHRWIGGGLDAGDRDLRFQTPTGPRVVHADAIVFALGGGSYPRMGSDGEWVAEFTERAVSVAPLLPANVGFEVAWSDGFRDRAEGAALKNVEVHAGGESAVGEVLITRYGLEGPAIYALGPVLRHAGELQVDLKPAWSIEQLRDRLSRPRGSASFATWLRKATRLTRPVPALLRESAPEAVASGGPAALAGVIKRLPISIRGPRPLAEAISSAGGVRFECMDDSLMLRDHPGVFVAGEMLDFEAPTGGYLLQGAFSTGHAAGCAVAAWLGRGG